MATISTLHENIQLVAAFWDSIQHLNILGTYSCTFFTYKWLLLYGRLLMQHFYDLAINYTSEFKLFAADLVKTMDKIILNFMGFFLLMQIQIFHLNVKNVIES